MTAYKALEQGNIFQPTGQQINLPFLTYKYSFIHTTFSTWGM